MSLDKLLALAERGRKMTRTPVMNADWYRITNTSDRAEVFIYAPISEYGVNANDFVRDLRNVKAAEIELHLNSPGGLVFDGITIYTALKNHAARIITHVDGIAASAASFIAMAGDEIVIQKPAKMMIHDAGGLVIGNASDMREFADLLDELSDTIAEIYTDRAGGSTDEWRAAMREETWYSAAQAVEAGLADRVADTAKPRAESLRSQLVRARARAALKG